MFRTTLMRKKEYLENALYISLAAFAFFLPISQKISTLFIVSSLLLCFTNVNQRNVSVLKKNAILIVLYFIFIFAYARDGMGFGFHWFETKASLVVFPILFYFTPVPYDRLVQIFEAFVFGCVISYFVCLVHPFVFSFDWSALEFLPIRSDVVSLPIKNENYNWLNYFISIGFNNTIDRAYLSCYTVYSLSFLTLFAKEFEKKVLVSLIFFMLLALVQIGSMSGIISLSVIPLLSFFYFKEKKIKLVSAGFYIAVFFTFFVTTNRFRMYYQEVSDEIVGTGLSQNTIMNDRIAFWKGSIAVFSENPIWGNGVQTAQKMMNEEQRVILGWSDQWVGNSNFNAHNLYLQLLIEMGIIGLSVYGIAILWLLYSARKFNRRMQFLTVFFILLFSIHSISESMFNRYVGISFFSFFYCLLMTHGSERTVLKR